MVWFDAITVLTCLPINLFMHGFKHIFKKCRHSLVFRKHSPPLYLEFFPLSVQRSFRSLLDDDSSSFQNGNCALKLTK